MVHHDPVFIKRGIPVTSSPTQRGKNLTTSQEHKLECKWKMSPVKGSKVDFAQIVRSV
jgi:hypothetical protein